jgi:signal peptidase II
MIEQQNVEPATESQPSADDVPASLSEKAIVYLVMASVLLVDILSKLAVESRIQLNTTWMPIEALVPIFRITHVSNTGAAFGLFPSGGNLFLIVGIVVSVFIIVFNTRLPANHYLYRVALGLQLGGALGNLLNRLRIGHVTDFLDFGPWPIFNVADMCVVAGVLLLAFLMLRDERRMQAENNRLQSEAVLAEKPDAENGDDQTMLKNE